MYRKSNMETYNTVCKIDSNENLLYGSGNSSRGPVSIERGWWGWRWGGGSKGRQYMYTYGWFMLRFHRKQNSVKQLSCKKKLIKKINFYSKMVRESQHQRSTFQYCKNTNQMIISVQFSSVAQLCPILCDPM